MKWWGPLSTTSHLGKGNMLLVSQPTLGEEKITNGVLILKRIKMLQKYTKPTQGSVEGQ